MKKLTIFLVFFISISVFSVLSCDNDETSRIVSAIIGAEGGSITSSDGKLTLDIPADALDEDIEITIIKINRDDLPPEFDEIDVDSAYLLEPDGLEFNVPVTAILALDDQPVQEDGSLSAALVLLITSSEGMLEVLENLTVEVDGDANTTTVFGELSHFSPLVDEIGGITGTVEGVPDSLEPGSTFVADVTITRPPFSHLRITEEFSTTYFDFSIFPIKPEFGPLVVIPFTINNNEQEQKQSFQYLCEKPGGQGLYKSAIHISVTEPAGRIPFLETTRIFLDFEKVVFCTTDPVLSPTPPPVTAPSPSPTPTPTPTPTPEDKVTDCNNVSFEVPVRILVIRDPTGQIQFLKGELPCDGSIIIGEFFAGKALVKDLIPDGDGGIPDLEGESLPGLDDPNVFIQLQQEGQQCSFSVTGTDTIAGVPGVGVGAEGSFTITPEGDIEDFFMQYSIGVDTPPELFFGDPTVFDCGQDGEATVTVP